MQFNKYTAELTALYLAVKQLWNYCQYWTCRIYTDSQAAIRAVDHLWRQPEQIIIKDILKSIDIVTNEHPHLQIEIIWVPGHTEIEGNERVDLEAKKLALTTELSQSYKYRPLKSVWARYIKAKAKKQ